MLEFIYDFMECISSYVVATLVDQRNHSLYIDFFEKCLSLLPDVISKLHLCLNNTYPVMFFNEKNAIDESLKKLLKAIPRMSDGYEASIV